MYGEIFALVRTRAFSKRDLVVFIRSFFYVVIVLLDLRKLFFRWVHGTNLLLEKLHHVISITCFIELSKLLMKLFRITIHHCDWVIAISHQATVHHNRSRSLICVIEKLTSRHEQKNSNGSFFRIFDLSL